METSPHYELMLLLSLVFRFGSWHPVRKMKKAELLFILVPGLLLIMASEESLLHLELP